MAFAEFTAGPGARALHPKAWQNLRAVIEHATGAPVDTLPMVRLRLR
ncbi:hypothetical protein [Nocardia mikamii]|nr:hypothetical protein [Nocardia mikamii]